MEEKQTLRDKLNEIKASLGRKKDQLYVWAGENKEIVAVAVPVIIGGCVEIIKLCIKRGNVQKEETVKNDYIYDRSHGHYYQIKHIKSDRKRNRVYSEIDRRHDFGESIGDILLDMDLLK